MTDGKSYDEPEVALLGDFSRLQFSFLRTQCLQGAFSSHCRMRLVFHVLNRLSSIAYTHLNMSFPTIGTTKTGSRIFPPRHGSLELILSFVFSIFRDKQL